MGESKKILVVEDEPVTRELLRGILLHAGYQVVLAEDGASALKMATSEKPDLVVTDGLLPKMHGFLLCKTLKEMPDPPRVIVVTGVYTKPTYKWEIKVEYHADDVLIKPFNRTHLLASVERLLSFSSQTESPAQSAVLTISRREFEDRLAVCSSEPFNEALNRKAG